MHTSESDVNRTRRLDVTDFARDGYKLVPNALTDDITKA